MEAFHYLLPDIHGLMVVNASVCAETGKTQLLAKHCAGVNKLRCFINPRKVREMQCVQGSGAINNKKETFYLSWRMCDLEAIS